MNKTLNLSFDYIMNNNTINSFATPLGVPSECYHKTSNSIVYNADCIIKNICPQITRYYITAGIIIISSYIFFSWFNWYLFNYGYKHLPDKNIFFIGNLHILNTRIYWDTFIKNKLLKVSMGFIALVVWFNLK